MNLTGDFSIFKPACRALAALSVVSMISLRPENRRRDDRDERELPPLEPVHPWGIRSEAFAEDLDDQWLRAGLPLPAR